MIGHWRVMRKLLKAPAVLLALAALVGCFNESDFDLDSEQVATILFVATDSGRASIPADGYTTIALVATIDANGSAAQIKFTTSEGTFQGAESSSPTTVTVAANSDGIARSVLISSRRVSDVVVRVESVANSQINRELELAFTEPVISNIIRFVGDNIVAVADGATLTTISVQVDPDIPAELRSVRFTTNRGMFAPAQSPGAVMPNSMGVATVDLTSPDEIGPARITATVNGFSTESGVEFVTALPESLVISSSALTVAADGDAFVSLTITISRAIGTPTIGQFANIVATNSNGEVLDFIRDVTLSDANGQISAKFFPGNTAERGDVTVRAVVPGSTAAGETKVTIVEPSTSSLSINKSIDVSAVSGELVQRLMRNLEFDGVLLTAEGAQVLEILGFGMADTLAGIPNTTQTRFRSELLMHLLLADEDHRNSLVGHEDGASIDAQAFVRLNLPETELLEPGQMSGVVPGRYAFGIPTGEDERRLYSTAADIFRSWDSGLIKCNKSDSSSEAVFVYDVPSLLACYNQNGDWTTALISPSRSTARIVLLSNSRTFDIEELLQQVSSAAESINVRVPF